MGGSFVLDGSDVVISGLVVFIVVAIGVGVVVTVVVWFIV